LSVRVRHRLLLTAVVATVATACSAAADGEPDLTAASPGPNGELVVANLGDPAMEGHTPRGFAGMGTGLFAGDEINPGFPAGDGVQLFVTFPLEAVGGDVVAATLRSNALRVTGTPFADLGPLQVEEVRYDRFGPELWDLEPLVPACTLETGAGSTVDCDVTDVVVAAAGASDRIQFRVRFEQASDADGTSDLAGFSRSDPNTNEPGLFELVVTTGSTDAAATATGGGEAAAPGPPLVLPLRLFLVDERDGPRSSHRTATELEAVVERAGEIWAPAGVAFDLHGVERVAVDGPALDALARGDLASFARAAPEAVAAGGTALVGFYAADIGGANGVTPNGSTVFFVVDEPTVHDERVTAHEIGHILGLGHVPPLDRLMASGVNGMVLDDDEITLARAVAARLLDLFRAAG
jgi:hypothetical protein